MSGVTPPGTISWRVPIARGRGEIGTASPSWRSACCNSLGMLCRSGRVPRRMFDAAERSLPLLGEHRLLLAVLEEAIWTYQRYAFANDRRGVMLLSQVEAWFAAEDSKWPFSFVAICDALGLETTYVRAGLRRLRDRDRVARQTGAPLQLCYFRRVSGTRHRTTRRMRNYPADRRASSAVLVRSSPFLSSPAPSGSPALLDRGRRARV